MWQQIISPLIIFHFIIRDSNIFGQSSFHFQCIYNENASKSRIDISDSELSNPIVTFGSVPRKIPIISHLGGYSLLIPNSLDFSNTEVVIQSENEINSINQLKPVNGNGFFTDFRHPNIEEALLFVYNDVLKSVVDPYVAHRSSAIGGGYNVILAEVNELYQQYGGVIPKHINGIRRFAHHMYDTAQDKPVGLSNWQGIREANVSSSTNIKWDKVKYFVLSKFLYTLSAFL